MYLSHVTRYVTSGRSSGENFKFIRYVDLENVQHLFPAHAARREKVYAQIVTENKYPCQHTSVSHNILTIWYPFRAKACSGIGPGDMQTCFQKKHMHPLQTYASIANMQTYASIYGLLPRKSLSLYSCHFPVSNFFLFWKFYLSQHNLDPTFTRYHINHTVRATNYKFN